MKRLIAAVFTLLMGSMAGLPLFSQIFKVKGIATDSTGVAESFATLRFYALPDTVKIVGTAATEEDGHFEKALPQAGKYRLLLSSTGRGLLVRDFTLTAETPTVSLDTLIVSDNQLAEVVVTAQRPLISREIDRIGYDVANDPEAKTSQLDEMLKKVPLVSVESDGTIKVKGSSNFVVHKNGRKNTSFTNNAKDIFKSIPASMIKKIEVITDPGAREDAEGSTTILNIVTEQNMIIKGVTGSAGLSYNNNLNVPSPNIWLTSQIDKVTFEIYGNIYATPSRSGKSHHETERTYDDTDNRSREWTEQRSSRNNGNVGFSVSVEPDTLNLFTGEFFAWIGSSKTKAHYSYEMLNPQDDRIYSYESNRLTSPSRNHWLDGTFNYQRLTRKKGEKIIVTYMISGNGNTTKESNEYFNRFNMPVDYTGILYDNRATLLEHTLQADWTRPLFKNHTLDLGAKYIYRDNHSTSHQDYLGIDRNYDTDFSHVTQIAAVFADYRINVGKFGFRAGVRYEYSRLAAKYKLGNNDDFHSNLNDVVPNGAISYNLNQSSSMRLSYSSSIRRPGINYLNPTLISNPQSESQGNPDLTSARNHSLNYNYSLFTRKMTMDFNMGYYFSDNEIIQIQELLPGDRVRSTYANAGKNHMFNVNVWMQLTAGKKTRLMLSAGMYYQHNENPSLKLRVSDWSPNIYVQCSQSLPWKLNLDAFVYYQSRSKSLYSVYEPVGLSKVMQSLSLRRSFLKENRLSVSIGVSNPLGNGRSRYRSYMINVPYESKSFSYNTNVRSVNFRVSYRFGSLNAQVKKVRSAKSDDVVGGNSH